MRGRCGIDHSERETAGDKKNKKKIQAFFPFDSNILAFKTQAVVMSVTNICLSKYTSGCYFRTLKIELRIKVCACSDNTSQQARVLKVAAFLYRWRAGSCSKQKMERCGLTEGYFKITFKR